MSNPMAKQQQSVIVIDSSDDEEVPSKKIALDRQIPAKITPLPNSAYNRNLPSTPMLPKISEPFPLAIHRQLRQMPQLTPAPHVRMRKSPMPQRNLSTPLNETTMMAPNWLQADLNPELTATTSSPKSSSVLSAPTPPIPILVAEPQFTAGDFACSPNILASAPTPMQKKLIAPITTAWQQTYPEWDSIFLDDLDITPSTSASAKLKQMQFKQIPCPAKVATSIDLMGSSSFQSPKVSNNQSSTSPTTTVATDLTITKVRLNGIAEGTAADTIASTFVEKAATPAHLPLEPDYEELIKACREADPTPDMEKVINNKLLKYYYAVHPDFVKSRGFRKRVRTVIEGIRAKPDLVYINLTNIVEELNARRKSKAVVVTNEENTGSIGNKHTHRQIKKLNKTLYVLHKRITRLEQAEVDLEEDDDNNSPYLQVERFKKRACNIYNKICDLTGESKNATRVVKKPIQFNGTAYPNFNKKLEAYINRYKIFPDFTDVLRMLEYCNLQYGFGLKAFEMANLAFSSFKKVGKLLQSRRKTDLYETVSHFTGNSADPAAEDAELQAKLNENQKVQRSIQEIIEKFARQQDLCAEEQKEIRKKKA